MTLSRFLSENSRWLGAGALLTFLSSFGQTFFISIFAGKIMETHGLSHGQWGGIYTLGTGASAVAMLWAGSLTDRYRARVLGAVVLVMLSGACLWMALNPFAAAVPVIIFALRFCGQGMLVHIAAVSMSRWFIATRGRALSVAGLGIAVGEAILPVAFVSLMIVMDWRWLWVVAALISVGAISVLWFLLKEERTPQSMVDDNQATGMRDLHWTRATVLRHPLFWFMVPALLGPSAFSTAFFFNQVHFADVKAISHLELVALFPIYTLIGVGMMVTVGWALDRFGTPRLIPWYQVPLIVAFLCFATAQSLPGILVGLIFLSMTTGANSVLPNAFWAEFYGTRNLGSIKAMAAAIMVLGSALGPGITGVLIDAQIGIETQYIGVACYFAFATIMMVIGVRGARGDVTFAAS